MPGRYQGSLSALVLIAFLLNFQTNGSAEPLQESSCAACHTDEAEQIQGSIHGRNGISCHHCHGGDPKKADKESAKAAGTGYLGIPDKQQIVETCGACHANVEAMNFYGIPTDQFSRYKTSVHGKELFGKGDRRVAGCSDCHGYHDVVAIQDPSSPVYPLNLPKTCNRCHGNEKLMAPYHLPTDIFESYSQSVHGRALFEKKDLSVAHCARCHGSHGAVPPGVKEIGATCGKCHANEKKYFLESPHAKLTEEGKFSECISCHGFHDIEHATPALYGTACVKCHAADSPAAQAGQDISKMLTESRSALTASEQTVKQASIEGIFVEDEEGLLEEMKTEVISMEPAQHALGKKALSESHAHIMKTAGDVGESVERKRRFLKWRKVALIPIWIFVAVMMTALWLKYRQIKAHNKKEKENPNE